VPSRAAAACTLAAAATVAATLCGSGDAATAGAAVAGAVVCGENTGHRHRCQQQPAPSLQTSARPLQSPFAEPSDSPGDAGSASCGSVAAFQGQQRRPLPQRSLYLQSGLVGSDGSAAFAGFRNRCPQSMTQKRTLHWWLWSVALGAGAWAGLHRGRGRRLRLSSEGSVGTSSAECPPPVLYPQRWVQLTFLALLALLSDLVCFSVAATPETWQKVFGQDSATLIDLFLFTNVFSCFLEPFLIRKLGLRIPIVAAAVLMSMGCALRSGVPFVGEQLPGYATVVAGTLMVAVAQPFFQCTPPLLSATWFAPNERALATAVAINFNQVGIATAFLVGGAMGGSEGGLKEYFGIITVASVLLAFGAFLGFQERPPTPPSASALEKEEAAAAASASDADTPEEPWFPEQASQLLRTPGFIPPLAAFVTSIAVTNVVGAFMAQKLYSAGIQDQGTIDLSGAGFEVAIVIGGIVLGGVVDSNKEYKSVTIACLAATLVAVLLLGLGGLPKVLVICALIAIGTFAGPVQPINAELAVEVTYPADENAIEAVQQLCGNLASALLVPLCEAAASWRVALPALPGSPSGSGNELHGDTILLLLIITSVGVYFSTFSAPLRRTLVDEENCLADQLENVALPAPAAGTDKGTP